MFSSWLCFQVTQFNEFSVYRSFQSCALNAIHLFSHPSIFQSWWFIKCSLQFLSIYALHYINYSHLVPEQAAKAVEMHNTVIFFFRNAVCIATLWQVESIIRCLCEILKTEQRFKMECFRQFVQLNKVNTVICIFCRYFSPRLLLPV